MHPTLDVPAARRSLRIGFIAAIAILAILGSTAAEAAPLKIKVLSSRADLVSGGDALVRIGVKKKSDARKLKVKLGKRNVTKQFSRRENGQIEALLKGIPNRSRKLKAKVPGRYASQIKLTGHPNGGPLISGPQLRLEPPDRLHPRRLVRNRPRRRRGA